MTPVPHLNKAPIVEGLIDIRVKPADGFAAEKLLAMSDLIKTRYPTHTEAMRIAASLQFKVGEAPEQSLTSQKVGYRFDSVERKFVLQVQHGGFTVSKLKPYETWESLLAEAKKLWPLYVDIAKPQVITRVATRYINRIELDMAGLDFDDYLSAPPGLPKALPQAVSEFLSRIVVRDTETDAFVVLTQALEQPNLVSKTIPVIIDIDVFKEASYAIDSNEYWELLAKFRDLKNRAFFGSITPKTLELFK
jgi:uncharacterized protein (TIGR04255 family)